MSNDFINHYLLYFPFNPSLFFCFVISDYLFLWFCNCGFVISNLPDMCLQRHRTGFRRCCSQTFVVLKLRRAPAF